MSLRTKYLIGGAAVLIVLLLLPIPNWIVGLVFLGILAAPVVGYFMLDPSQRRRVRRRGRKQIGR
ncbi:MAG: hypothetical protein GEV03_28775 [Streptosporangiales bacterium]|nr:hypothetical protein [Streptosporangiales bacterium]